MTLKADLFNYKHPDKAQRVLALLRKKYPLDVFEVVPSPLAIYAFRYLIFARHENGKSGFVNRCPIAGLGA
jgi:hypothetical protein